MHKSDVTTSAGVTVAVVDAVVVVAVDAPRCNGDPCGLSTRGVGGKK